MTKTNRARLDVPTVSHTSNDGLLVEVVYNPMERHTEFAVASPDGIISTEPHVDLTTGERLVPYSASNNLIASGCVLLPSGVGDVGDDGDLVEEVTAFIHRYVDLPPLYEQIAAHYVLLSWVHDAFNELPYLRFRGDYGTGKTRALLTVGSLCYKPFFASGASTVSPIFHVLDAFGGTLILDEADFRFSDATAELTKILNNGNMKGLPVLRTMANRHRELNPQAFRVFGPKLIGMRGGFSDRALESRFLTIETSGRSLRSDIPIHLPESLRMEALELRNKLLAWRFRERRSIRPDPSRIIPGIEPRLNQTALALLSIVHEAALRTQIAAELTGEGQRVKEERAQSEEGIALAALDAAFQDRSATHVAVAEVARRLNENRQDEPLVTNKRVGWLLRDRLRLITAKSNGVYVVPDGERAKVEALAIRYGLRSAA
jgi:hypothetical protein